MIWSRRDERRARDLRIASRWRDLTVAEKAELKELRLRETIIAARLRRAKARREALAAQRRRMQQRRRSA